ncbi:hypothetical protein DFS34DRAFT_368059 [Phlyctochytrium arcticum]|nr:hypothetical protein DFS34DRAFT_368059 [Phlyctochytrium arcticum]
MHRIRLRSWKSSKDSFCTKESTALLSRPMNSSPAVSTVQCRNLQNSFAVLTGYSSTKIHLQSCSHRAVKGPWISGFGETGYFVNILYFGVEILRIDWKWLICFPRWNLRSFRFNFCYTLQILQETDHIRCLFQSNRTGIFDCFQRSYHEVGSWMFWNRFVIYTNTL